MTQTRVKSPKSGVLNYYPYVVCACVLERLERASVIQAYASKRTENGIRVQHCWILLPGQQMNTRILSAKC